MLAEKLTAEEIERGWKVTVYVTLTTPHLWYAAVWDGQPNPIGRSIDFGMTETEGEAADLAIDMARRMFDSGCRP